MKYNFKNISLKRISLRQINTFLKKLYSPLLIIIALLLFLTSVFVAYEYVYRLVGVESKIDVTIEDVNQELLEEVLANIDFRRETLERVKRTNYNDPFN